jgi:hypothetical protein
VQDTVIDSKRRPWCGRQSTPSGGVSPTPGRVMFTRTCLWVSSTTGPVGRRQPFSDDVRVCTAEGHILVAEGIGLHQPSSGPHGDWGGSWLHSLPASAQMPVVDELDDARRDAEAEALVISPKKNMIALTGRHESIELSRPNVDQLRRPIW